jgi:hypothetical protein
VMRRIVMSFTPTEPRLKYRKGVPNVLQKRKMHD